MITLDILSVNTLILLFYTVHLTDIVKGQLSPEDEAKIDDFMTDLMECRGMPGVSLALVKVSDHMFVFMCVKPKDTLVSICDKCTFVRVCLCLCVSNQKTNSYQFVINVLWCEFVRIAGN